VTGRLERLAGRRILVVEDEYFIADEVANGLRAAGAEVLGPFPTIERARRGMVAQTGRVDAAVLDLNLAGQSSVELIRSLRQAEIPVLIATGYDTAHLAPDVRQLPRCEKPFNSAALLETLAGLLE
jgi:DNA-binding response OmpR family regulator